jgi:aspartyl-tRNA(Asn)/glutamyl-tRNA(Gln) amidotransferase subunit A
VPCGFVDAGPARLPVGLQLLGKPFGEQPLLNIAAAYEAATDWHRIKPSLGAK